LSWLRVLGVDYVWKLGGEGSMHQDADALAGKGFVLGEVGEKLAAVQVEQEKNRT